MEMQWWIWLVFGIALILLELVLPTFFILWFGIGAVLVSLTSLAAPSLQLDMQVLLWVLLSSVTTAYQLLPMVTACALAPSGSST